MDDHYYVDTMTGVIRTAVEGGSGILAKHLPAEDLLDNPQTETGYMKSAQNFIENIKSSTGIQPVA